VTSSELKHSICSLFTVLEDQGGVQRVVTPIELGAGSDAVVVRVRPLGDGAFQVDENGEAALHATMAGGDVESDAVERWLEDICSTHIMSFKDEVLSVTAYDKKDLALSILRVAQAADQLYALSTSRAARQESDFKNRLSKAIEDAASEYHFGYEVDVELPIAGNMHADFVINSSRPMVVIAANSLTRLLEAEVIHMQYKLLNRRELVVAVAESQAAVGKKHFERASYYTDKTVSFDPTNLQLMLGQHVRAIQ
jgi:hypothetical protein